MKRTQSLNLAAAMYIAFLVTTWKPGLMSMVYALVIVPVFFAAFVWTAEPDDD